MKTTLTLVTLLLSAAPARAQNAYYCADLALKSIQLFAHFNEDKSSYPKVLINQISSPRISFWSSADSERKYDATTTYPNGACLLTSLSMSTSSLFGYRPAVKPEVCKKAVQVALSMFAYLNGRQRAPESFELTGPFQLKTELRHFMYNWFAEGKTLRVRTMQNGIFTDGDCRVQEIDYNDLGLHPGAED